MVYLVIDRFNKPSTGRTRGLRQYNAAHDCSNCERCGYSIDGTPCFLMTLHEEWWLGDDEEDDSDEESLDESETYDWNEYNKHFDEDQCDNDD